MSLSLNTPGSFDQQSSIGNLYDLIPLANIANAQGGLYSFPLGGVPHVSMHNMSAADLLLQFFIQGSMDGQPYMRILPAWESGEWDFGQSTLDAVALSNMSLPVIPIFLNALDPPTGITPITDGYVLVTASTQNILERVGERNYETRYYCSQYLSLTPSTTYDVFNVNIPPSNSITGVRVYNHTTSPDLIYLFVSGDGTYNNHSPQAGYTDSANSGIPVWPGQPFSMDIRIRTGTYPGPRPGANVRIVTPSTAGTYACAFCVDGY